MTTSVHEKIQYRRHITSTIIYLSRFSSYWLQLVSFWVTQLQPLIVVTYNKPASSGIHPVQISTSINRRMNKYSGFHQLQTFSKYSLQLSYLRCCSTAETFLRRSGDGTGKVPSDSTSLNRRASTDPKCKLRDSTTKPNKIKTIKLS